MSFPSRYAPLGRPPRISLSDSARPIRLVGDLIPAFKFARREGLRVFLCHLGHGIKRELRAHADRIISIELPAALSAERTLEEAA